MCRPAGFAITAFLSFFGCWTVFCNLAVLLEFSLYGLFYTLPLLALAVFVVFRHSGRDSQFSTPHLAAPKELTGFILAVVLAVAITYLAHRPDLDDSHYINMAVGVLDFKHQPMLKFDTMHGIAGLPIHLSNYRFQSYELLAALISWLTKLPVIVVMHAVLPVVFAGLTVSAYVLLYTRLLPESRIAAVFINIAVLLILCGFHRDYGNFGFLRLFQGKAILVTLMMPLIWWAVINFYDNPGKHSWFILLLTQICGVGLSTNGLFVAPLMLGITSTAEILSRRGDFEINRNSPGLLAWMYVACLPHREHRGIKGGECVGTMERRKVPPPSPLCLRWGKPRVRANTWVVTIILKNWLATLSACFYPVMCAIIILAFMPSPKSALMGMHHTASQTTELFGEGWLAALHWLALLLGWVCVPGSRDRLFFVSFLSIIFLINPLLAPYWSKYITINHNWRLLWAVPIPAIMTLALAALLHIPIALQECDRYIFYVLRMAAKPAPCASILLAKLLHKTAFFIREQYKSKCFFRLPASGFRLQLLFILALFTAGMFIALRDSNNTSISFSPIKAPAADYNAARVLRAKAGAHRKVIAPEAVSGWLVTMHNHPYPIVARGIYFNLLRSLLPPDTWNELHKAEQLIDGTASIPGSSHALHNIMTSESICWVMIAQANQFMPDIQKILGEDGFKEDSTTGGYILYHKKACL